MEGVFAAESALEVDSAGSVYVGRGGEVAVYAGWGAAGGGPVARLAGFKDVAGLDVHDAKSQKWLFVSDAGDHRVKVRVDWSARPSRTRVCSVRMRASTALQCLDVSIRHSSAPYKHRFRCTT